MLKITAFCFTLLVVTAEDIIGPGKWKMLKIDREKSDTDKFEFDIVQRKYNRTFDIFQGVMTFHKDLDDSFGANIEVCKYVDGGCKPFLVINDNSFGELVGKYAEDNFMDMMAIAGMKDAKFPIPMGKYEVQNYLWNWNSMPEECPYGRFNAKSCVTELAQNVGCLVMELLYEKIDDEE